MASLQTTEAGTSAEARLPFCASLHIGKLCADRHAAAQPVILSAGLAGVIVGAAAGVAATFAPPPDPLGTPG